jgi:hypothetical protein
MREIFRAHFRPTVDELNSLWKSSTFAVDTNVLLNLYRYSAETREALQKALGSVSTQLFLPHQAAREYFKNRANVTADQADSYTKAIKTITELARTLSDKKNHPFLPEAELPNFNEQVAKLRTLLEDQQKVLLQRLTNDEILDFLETIFSNRTGSQFSEADLKQIEQEGEIRYQKEIPPGFKDGKKDSSGDPLRKFGDLIVWKQLIARGKAENKPIIFVTDDKKEDWWQEQSGQTIGPRTELREEFLGSVGQDFWMYTVDLFMKESAHERNEPISPVVLAEIKSVSADVKAQSEVKKELLDAEIYHTPFYSISVDELVEKLKASEEWSKRNADGFVGLASFVRKHLGEAGFDYSSTYDVIRKLESDGKVEIYAHENKSFPRPVTAIRLIKEGEYANRPFERLNDILPRKSEGNP